jgi:ABC-type multidrug transport system fused ATPase/permease subunit
MMYDPIKKLGNVGEYVAQGTAALDRIGELAGEPVAIARHDGAGPVPRARGALSFDRVSFAYEQRPVLDGLDFRVAPGTLCALVGRSGAGKSTLMQLVLRFYDPAAGVVSLDGVDLREWPLVALRRQLAWVSQDVFLFNASVRANLCAGDGFSDTDIAAGLEAAHASDFVRALPHGLDTVLGERGVTLSGGERQRIAIARAFLRNAPLLLLDEATSALDAQSERMVQDALDRLMVGRTTLVIAHRLSTVRRAEQIAVLEHGRITQVGTHAELFARPGAYQELAALQLSDVTEPAA